MSDTYKNIYECIRNIPMGKVSTYKRVANQAGYPGQPRLVGYALNKLKSGNNIPWHRVINSKGKISLQNGYDQIQLELLRKEGIIISDNSKIDLNKFGWY